MRARTIGGRRPGLPAAVLPLLLLLGSAALAPAAEEAPPRPLLVTVDDLPIAWDEHVDPADRERITRGLLDALQKHGIRAVGLVTWSRLRDPADRRLLELWLEAGHELGNHSYKHLSYTRTDPETYIADIEAARRELASLLEPRGGAVRFFRFPFLREGDTPQKLEAMRAYLQRTGQRNLPVTIDDQDWSFEKPWVEARRRGDEAALRRIGEEYQRALRLEVEHHERRGDELFGRRVPQILLLHANEVGAAQWDALFTWLEQSGHRFASADEVLADPAYSEPHAYVGTHGPGLWDRLLDRKRRKTVEEEVRKTLEEQIGAWNRGDLEAFCAAYAEDASFLSPSGFTQGRQAVLERYRKRYADKAAMGTLALEVLEVRLAAGMEVTQLGGAVPSRVHGATVAARWTLAYPDKEPATGLTLIVLRPRSGGGWEIAQDASM